MTARLRRNAGNAWPLHCMQLWLLAVSRPTCLDSTYMLASTGLTITPCPPPLQVLPVERGAGLNQFGMQLAQVRGGWAGGGAGVGSGEAL